jgi:hypothetical protein
VKSIYTLIPDIYSLVGGPNGITNLPPDLGGDIQKAVSASLGSRESRGLRLSGMGDKCPCALWYSVNHPELEEALPPYARIKYCYGHIIEHLIIALAKAAGHTVEGEQDEILLDGIRGHRDCIIDGCIVDVKSAATRSFAKFKVPASDPASIANDDPFGYLVQLDGYVVGSLADERVKVKDRGYLLAVDKQLGHLALYEHRIRERHVRERIGNYKQIVSSSQPPRCECKSVPDGKSGNLKLDTRASYSTYKYCCKPNLRTFLYADGPRYLTKVVREPNGITEVDSKGKVVYH